MNTPSSKLPNPTPQGEEIISAWTSEAKPSIMVKAYAGCGKTTFLQQLAPHIREPRVLFLAFNKRNAEDLKAKLPSRFETGTMNSLGHRALGRALPRRLQVEANKTSQVLKAQAEEWNLGKLEEEVYNGALTLVRTAKGRGLMHSTFPAFKTLIPDESSSWEALCDEFMIDYSPDLVRLAREVLRKSIKLALDTSLIDYDDQIYLSTLALGTYEKFQVVGVDEAQDLSPLNHIQLKKSLAPGGRLLVVGDPKQAIYAFRGASSSSMPQIAALREGMQEFPLSLTFRCSKLVVERNKSHAPGFEAAPGNLPGQLHDLRARDEWSLEDLPRLRTSFLCRNNAPLLSCAFRLIASGTGVTMLGRDIGKSLITLLRKIAGTRPLPLPELSEKIQNWKRTQLDLAFANQKEQLISGIEDRADSLLAVVEGVALLNEGATTKEVEASIISLFEDQGGLIVLGTGHRAKGMEWPQVIHLNPFLLPSRQAQKARDAGNPIPMEQELNLRYVIETRSQDSLVLANLKGFQP